MCLVSYHSEDGLRLGRQFHIVKRSSNSFLAQLPSYDASRPDSTTASHIQITS